MPPRVTPRPLVLALAVAALLAAWVVPATAADTAADTAAGPTATTLTISSERGYADTDAPLALRLTDASGAPVAGASVVVERRVDAAWTTVASVVTGDDGTATTTLVRARESRDNRVRATYAGTSTYAPATSPVLDLPLLRRTGVLDVGGPSSVVDERSTRVVVAWRTSQGDPVAGRVRLLRREGGQGEWSLYRVVTTGADGRAAVTVTPRVDTRWRATAPASDWLTAARSGIHRLDNLPPGVPVVLPAGAPSPRITLPPQPRATGDGPHPVVTPIPDGVWASMTGRSWHAGCPVGRAGLRLLRINYWGYDGYRYRGEIVAATSAVDNMAGALAEMYAGRYPIRSMYLVDRFGWSPRLQGANDYRSMAAGNTSAFNCRSVVNRPGVRSPHATGRSLDVNTWENPYRSATGLVPNSWWQGHSHPRVAWRSSSHPVVRIMARHGLAWTYASGDSQHFDVRG